MRVVFVRELLGETGRGRWLSAPFLAWFLFGLMSLHGGVSAALAAEREGVSRFLSDFQNLPPCVYRPDLARSEIQESLSGHHAGFLRFLAEHPGRWQADWNEAAETPHRIYGDSFPLLLGGGQAPR